MKKRTHRKGMKMKKLNGRMTNSEEEVKQLGKEMESLQTQSELSEKGWTSDPIQYE